MSEIVKKYKWFVLEKRKDWNYNIYNKDQPDISLWGTWPRGVSEEKMIEIFDSISKPKIEDNVKEKLKQAEQEQSNFDS